VKVYIASRLENIDNVKLLGDFLRGNGHEITYDWTTHGPVYQHGTARLQEVQRNELQGIADADMVIALLPGGRGTHFELGYATGLYIPILLVGHRLYFVAGPETCAFYHGEAYCMAVGGAGFGTQMIAINAFLQKTPAELLEFRAAQLKTFSTVA
jgi:hypothetical protein